MDIQLTAALREDTGKGAAHRLRRSGQIPAVLSRRGKFSIALSVDGRELGQALSRGALRKLVRLSTKTGKYAVLLKEMQLDPVKGQPLHLDFVEVAMSDPVEVKVSIHVVGDAHRTVDGGIIEQQLHELLVSCLPTAIPERVEVSPDDMRIGTTVFVKNLPVPSGVKVLTEPEEIVLICNHTPVPTIAEEGEEIETKEE